MFFTFLQKVPEKPSRVDPYAHSPEENFVRRVLYFKFFFLLNRYRHFYNKELTKNRPVFDVNEIEK